VDRGLVRDPRPGPPRSEGRAPVSVPWRIRLERHLLAHVDLYLSVFAVGVALVLPLALELGTDVQELAGAALAACVIQGVAHWLLRRRVTAVRRELIAEVRALLRDRINNQLQVVLFSLADRRPTAETAEDRKRLAMALGAISSVTRTLDELSTDSLRLWKDRYAGSLDGAPGAGEN
jgi:hypothetical protein